MRLLSSFDKQLGCQVVHDEQGEIRLIVPNGKLSIKSLGVECKQCKKADGEFADRLSELWNTSRHSGLSRCSNTTKTADKV